MKGFFHRTAIFIVGVFVIIFGFRTYFSIDEYPLKLSTDNSITKLKGLYLLENAPQKDILLLGASELNTLMIETNPTNFFAQDNDFTVNMIGRGSAQAIVHASILAATKDIENKKVAIIISPQSFVKQGIAADMFFANFSPLQYLTIQQDETLPTNIKQTFSKRYLQLYDTYTSANVQDNELYSNKILVQMFEGESLQSNVLKVALKPYVAWKYNLLQTKDICDTYKEFKTPEKEINKFQGGNLAQTTNWETAKEQLLEIGEKASDNNEFGFLNDYYNSNIGMRLDDYDGKFADLSYEQSTEYEDLQLLLEICKEKGVVPLVFHTPLNGKWSDYTGFKQEARAAYYNKVTALLSNYNVKIADLTTKEYEPYYLCDVMHLGWIGWLEIDEKLGEFFYEY